MKRKLFFIFVPVFFICTRSNGQYKDLEGVFFGKVVSAGAGWSYKSHTDKIAGNTSAIAPLIYNVHLNNKTISSMRFALPGKVTANTSGNDGSQDYTRRDEFKFFDLEFIYRFGITKDGTDKPLSAFVNLHLGGLFGNHKTFDSRYGEVDNLGQRRIYIGAGFTVFQRLGSRLLLFAEPSYRYDFSFLGDKIYVDDTDSKEIRFSHINAQAGILILIGKTGG
jgi:hypothetical protein